MTTKTRSKEDTVTREQELELPAWDWDVVSQGLDPNKEEAAKFLIPAFKARKHFGLWDCCDPVATAIINLVTAQNELSG